MLRGCGCLSCLAHHRHLEYCTTVACLQRGIGTVTLVQHTTTPTPTQCSTRTSLSARRSHRRWTPTSLLHRGTCQDQSRLVRPLDLSLHRASQSRTWRRNSPAQDFGEMRKCVTTRAPPTRTTMTMQAGRSNRPLRTPTSALPYDHEHRHSDFQTHIRLRNDHEGRPMPAYYVPPLTGTT